MVSKDTDFTRISIYVPKPRQADKPIERLMKLGMQRDRTLNYMMIEALLDYVNCEEKK